MLKEYAIVPDIFDPAGYSHADVCREKILVLKDALLDGALVRDLADGGWTTALSREGGRLHPRTKELLRKLIQSRRVARAPMCGEEVPRTAEEWCVEALRSHSQSTLDGVLTPASVAHAHSGNDLVCSIARIPGSSWWRLRQEPSVEVERSTQSYLQVLGRILGHANSVMFIDPYIDPMTRNYREFGQLLGRIPLRPRRLVEIHRARDLGSGRDRTILTAEEWRGRFAPLDAELRAMGLPVEVHIWDRFHDRFLITDIVGVGLLNGFDTAPGGRRKTTWVRLGRTGRDGRQREFDPAASFRRHHFSFRIGPES